MGLKSYNKEAEMEVQDFFPKLSTLDRCDSCQARAVTAVLVNADTSMLFFCGHHLRKHRAFIEESGYPYLLNDEIRRDALFELPPQPAVVGG